MILVWGQADDPPVERILGALAERDREFVHIDDAALATLRYDVVLDATPTGWFEAGGRRIALDELCGIYLRPGETPSGTSAAAAATTLIGLAAVFPGMVVNRPAAGRSNWSKPFQLRLIAAAGLDVPDTLVTSSRDAAHAFLVEHGRVVYKSISGIRSIVSSLDVGGARLDAVTSGPVQFQQYIAGTDVRVHVVGDRCIAAAIYADSDDYRYAARNGTQVAMKAIDLPTALAARLIALNASMGLVVSGIDLRVTASGRHVCFEVNPSPGFSFYEDATGQAIAEAIVDLFEDC